MLINENIGSLIVHVLPGSVVNSLSLSLDFLNVYRNLILTEIFIMIFLKIIICNELPSVYSNVIIYARQNWIDWIEHYISETSTVSRNVKEDVFIISLKIL